MALTTTIRVDYHESAERALTVSGDMRDFMQHVGDGIARDARAAAPKHTGAGALSIHGETALGPHGWEAKVSWSEPRYYMTFSETGTVHMAARPFLVPALERARI
jgi:hypothetical protein